MPTRTQQILPSEFRPNVGLLTEANTLDFPPGASTDEANFTLNRKGERARRLGMDFEDLGTLTAVGLTETQIKNAKVSGYLWEFADENTSVSLAVIAIQSRLWFFDGGEELTSGNQKNLGPSGNATGYIDLSGGDSGDLQYASIAGDLYVVNGSQQVHVLSYDSSTDTVTTDSFRLKIRDVFGIDDGLANDTRPSSLSNSHNYNLQNQGWPDEWTAVGDPLDQFFSTHSEYPSNSDIFHLGLYFVADRNFTTFNAREIASVTTGEAPKGHYIIDAFNRGASRESRASEHPARYSTPFGFPDDESTGGVRGIASYAGRLWYCVTGGEEGTDDRSPYLSTFLLYSKIVDSKDDAAKCYTRNDPTDKDFSDVLDTDGGFIRLPEAKGLHRLVPVQDSLVALAENGIWQVRGGDSGFSATNQSVTKISSAGSVGPGSVVPAEGAVFYMSDAGISVIQPDATSLNLIPQNITENSIQTFFNAIPSTSRQNARGVFDTDQRQVRWLYNSGEAWYNPEFINRYNRELILDLLLPAWTVNALSDDGADTSPGVHGIVRTRDFVSNTSTEVVTDSVGDTVTDSSSEDVTVTYITRSVASTRNKYIILVEDTSWKFGFGYYRNASFRDYPDYSNSDASAYLITGDITLQDTQRRKSSAYLTVHCERTENGFEEGSGESLTLSNQSSCLVQPRWDFTNSTNAGRWGEEFEAYRLNPIYIPASAADTFDYSYAVVSTKNKLRGRGRALALKFSSAADKDLRLLGWAADITGTLT